MNRLHERILRIIYDDYESCFEQLLEKDQSVSIQHLKIRRLLIEMYKAFNTIKFCTIVLLIDLPNERTT